VLASPIPFVPKCGSVVRAQSGIASSPRVHSLNDPSLGRAPPPQIFRDLESPATRGMNSLRAHRSAAPARISTVGGRPIPIDSAAQRRNPPGRNNLVSPRTLAGRILAARVRRHHPPHSPARPQAHSGRGGEEARVKDGEAPGPLRYRPLPPPALPSQKDPHFPAFSPRYV
jgi:hypothetical protein